MPKRYKIKYKNLTSDNFHSIEVENIGSKFIYKTVFLSKFKGLAFFTMPNLKLFMLKLSLCARKLWWDNAECSKIRRLSKTSSWTYA